MHKFTHFERSEFDCSHTGKNEMRDTFIHSLDHLRSVCGFAFVINSGYRDKTHPIEAIKKTPGSGSHCQGYAADIQVDNSVDRAQICKHALALGFSVGPQHGFVHVDKRPGKQLLWVY